MIAERFRFGSASEGKATRPLVVIILSLSAGLSNLVIFHAARVFI
jgi:hypothetical protein